MKIVLYVCAIGFLIITIYLRQLDVGGKDFVDKVVNSVVARDWSEEEFERNVATRLLKDRDHSMRVFASARLLGSPLRIESASGRTINAFKALDGEPLKGVYVKKVFCEHGRATLLISIIKEGEFWKVNGLDVNLAH